MQREYEPLGHLVIWNATYRKVDGAVEMDNEGTALFSIWAECLAVVLRTSGIMYKVVFAIGS